MDILQLVDELEDLMEDASGVPLSRKVMVDPDEIFEILKEIRERLPQEIRDAMRITEDEQRILGDANRQAEEIRSNATRDADRISTEAQNRLQEMINDHDITKSAQNLAHEIESKAEQNARSISMQATQYIDSMFVNAQNKLQELNSIIDESRQELHNQR